MINLLHSYHRHFDIFCVLENCLRKDYLKLWLYVISFDTDTRALNYPDAIERNLIMWRNGINLDD